MLKGKNIDEKITAIANRPLTPAEIFRIEVTHAARKVELDEVNNREFVQHTNLLVAHYEELRRFAKTFVNH
tara:strand:+ start:154 stop:366 length:213 start_codon:yes stop_codon:yes gene_type:complete